MGTSSPSALLGPVYLLTNGSPAQKEIILPGAESSDRGQPPLPGGEGWTGNRGNSGRGQRQRHIEGSEKTDGARQGLGAGGVGAEGGTVWRPSPWTSFSKTPGWEPRSEPGAQGPRCPPAHQSEHLVGFDIHRASELLTSPLNDRGTSRHPERVRDLSKVTQQSLPKLRQEPRLPASLGCHKSPPASVEPSGVERKTMKKAEGVRQSRDYGVCRGQSGSREKEGHVD